MIERIIELCVRNKAFVILLTLALIVAGVVGVLMANQLELASHVMYGSLAAFLVGALLAWKGASLRAA